ncbi:laminin subunit alpha-4-like, partial [Hippocampus comes]|uniref:laminin subunit alpha-4-like n=1 Tax=Hippocampus comes TaxID=109280 RepID=UPI00094E4684
PKLGKKIFVYTNGNQKCVILKSCLVVYLLSFRIYQDAELILTKDFTSDTPGIPSVGSVRGDETKNLLDFTPEDLVFYVGGYPSNFTPPAPLNYPMYKGCIEMAYLNDRVVSLYHFLRKDNINVESPCKRLVPVCVQLPPISQF